MPKFTSNRFENKLWLLRYAKYVKNSDNKSEGIKSTPFLQYVGSYLNVYLPKLQRHQGTIKTLRSSLSLFIRFIRKIKALPVVLRIKKKIWENFLRRSILKKFFRGEFWNKKIFSCSKKNVINL